MMKKYEAVVLSPKVVYDDNTIYSEQVLQSMCDQLNSREMKVILDSEPNKGIGRTVSARIDKLSSCLIIDTNISEDKIDLLRVADMTLGYIPKKIQVVHVGQSTYKIILEADVMTVEVVPKLPAEESREEVVCSVCGYKAELDDFVDEVSYMGEDSIDVTFSCFNCGASAPPNRKEECVNVS